MIRNTLIDGKQIVMLLVMFRVFNMLTFVPQMQGVQNAATVMLALPFAYLLLILILLPAALLLNRHRESNIIDCALKLSKPAGKVLGVLLFLYAVLIAADTVSNFEFLLTSVVYPETKSIFFILTFTAVCVYGAYMGLEPVTRVNTILFFISLFSIIFISVAVLPDAEFVYLQNPLYGGVAPVAKHALSACFANFDVVLWLLLAPDLKGNLNKNFVYWTILSLFAVEYLVMLLTVGLGDYAKSQMFPFFSLTVIAEISIFQRLDILHITLWTFIAFVKVTVYLYLASQCLGYIIPKRLKKTRLIICGAATVGGAVIISSRLYYLTWMQGALQAGIPVALLAVLIPFVLLIWSLVSKRGKAS
ncbi:GerAB/ArcD/ProY family transporter [Hydrogenoanaerobacterium sp.]|uniref:GerAB/ArcD/ProY family transporter n=1 Tax=Hydrogenoanaerobacterium sp. TaxID=2953763 RepID=UPI00289F3F2C|nr:GerAB/ArcD/ProY family transporter [Hydrogenoanaerobacterium sp.]